MTIAEMLPNSIPAGLSRNIAEYSTRGAFLPDALLKQAAREHNVRRLPTTEEIYREFDALRQFAQRDRDGFREMFATGRVPLVSEGTAIAIRDRLNDKDVKVFHWRTDIYFAAINGCEQFRGMKITDDTLRLWDKAEWWSTDHIRAVRADALNIVFKDTWRVPALELLADFFIVWHDSGEMFHFMYLLVNEGNADRYVLRSMPYKVGDTIGAAFAEYAASASFRRLPFATTERKRLSATLQKQAARRNIPEIRTVVLRKREVAADRLTSASDSSLQREYSCQWIVSGHWRKQWYPSRQVHEPVYISPYVKGPDDKPLRSRVTVYEMRR